jgi:hypothetical protein
VFFPSFQIPSASSWVHRGFLVLPGSSGFSGLFLPCGGDDTRWVLGEIGDLERNPPLFRESIDPGKQQDFHGGVHRISGAPEMNKESSGIYLRRYSQVAAVLELL